MNFSFRSLFFLIGTLIPTFLLSVYVGIGKADITPPLGTPSAGYIERKGEGMIGEHDPLLAIALYIETEDKKIVLCSVDHLGFTYEMVQEIIEKVHSQPNLFDCDIYIASSHTHSGGGAFLNLPKIGELLAGHYNRDITNFYIQKTVEAIIGSTLNPIPGKIGIGYGNVENMTSYRGTWPKDVIPLSDISIIKVTRLDDSPFSILFNFPVHPTILKSQNRFFSSDFVGYARDYLRTLIGGDIQPIYFNGAQGDILPAIDSNEDGYLSANSFGQSLASLVQKIWKKTETSESFHIKTIKTGYSFIPMPTPFGILLPVDNYKSEINLIIFNQLHAFITIPGELSCLYDKSLKNFGEKLGFIHLSVFGLTNDAQGYIITPESFNHKTMESRLSFGGEKYGELIESKAKHLLEENIPK